MNTPNNKRKKESQRRIENAFVQLLLHHDIKDLSVSDICREAQVNRTTFYASYVDVNALAQAVQLRMENEVLAAYDDQPQQQKGSRNYLMLFRHIKENRLFYSTYFKLGLEGQFASFGYDREEAAAHYGERFVDYHMAFFQAGLNALIKMWLKGGCKESPEEMNDILQSEYFSKQRRFSLFR